MIKCVIFDFDGTLADTANHTLKVYNILAEKNGYTKYTEEDLERLKTMSLKSAMHLVDVPFKRIPSLIREGQKLFRSHVGSVEMFGSDLPQALKEIKEMCGIIGIISSNTKKNITMFLENNDLRMMDFIIPSPLFSKESKIEKVRRRYHLEKSDMLYVGDEIRDIESAKNAGIPIISVSWGFNNREVLSRCSPDYIIDDVSELVGAVAAASAGNDAL